MNLNEILSYRTHCPICKRKLQLRSESKGFKLKLAKGSLQLYIKDLAESVSIIDDVYQSSIPFKTTIHCRKFCKGCYLQKSMITPHAGMNTLGSLVAKAYYYDFEISLENGKCSYQIFREYVSYQKDKFLHTIDNHKVEDKMFLRKFDSILNMWKLETTSKNLSDYAGINELLKMIDLYITFS